MNRIKYFFESKKHFALVLVVFAVSVIACEKYVIEGPVKPKDVSFANDIVPIFTKNCVSCHTAGKTAPNLDAAAAYSSITSRKLVTVSAPETSKLYDKLLSSPLHMPKATPAEKLTILTWIEEGAKDN